MSFLKKTEAGTIGSYGFEKNGITGVASGVHKSGNFVSIEYHEDIKKIILLINDERINQLGIEVRHCNNAAFDGNI